MNSTKTYKTIDEYIDMFPKEVQDKLQSIRKTIKKEAPEAIEAISYMMPTFKMIKGKNKYRNLIHFAAFKNHIGIYPTPSGIEFFKDELKNYEISKGTIRIPNDKPLPLDMIKRIVKVRLEQESK